MEASVETGTALEELSRILITGDGGFYLQHVRETLVRVNPADLSRFILDCDEFLFRSILYYIRLFRKEEAIARIVNDEAFSIEALERILLAIHLQYMIRGISVDELFEEQLFALNQERILDLLVNGEYIPIDQRISLNLIARLDREHLEKFIHARSNPIPYLGNLIKGLPEDVRRDFLFRNPELYGYLKLFFEFDENADQEVYNILMGYSDDIEEAIRTLVISKKFSSETENQTFTGINLSAERLQKIIDDLKHVNDRERALELLHERHIFVDEREYLIVKNILMNPYFSDILDAIPEFQDQDLDMLKGTDLKFF